MLKKIKSLLIRAIFLIVVALIFATIHDYLLLTIGIIGFSMTVFVPDAQMLHLSEFVKHKNSGSELPDVLHENFLISFIKAILTSFGTYYTVLQGWPIFIPFILVVFFLVLGMIISTRETYEFFGRRIGGEYGENILKNITKSDKRQWEPVLERKEVYELPNFSYPFDKPIKTPPKINWSSKVNIGSYGEIKSRRSGNLASFSNQRRRRTKRK